MSPLRSNLRRLLGGLLLLTSFLAPRALGATVTNSPAVLPTVMPDAGASLIRVMGAFAIVVAVFLAAVYAFRHWQRLLLRRGKSPQLQVIEARSLGQRHALYVVGYREQRLLIAASPGGVTLLTQLPIEEAPPQPVAQVPTTEDFTSALQQALQARS